MIMSATAESKLTAVLRDEVYKNIELVHVISGEIEDKRCTSNIVRHLNAFHPLPEKLAHLKRVRCCENKLTIIVAIPKTNSIQDELHSLQQSLNQHPDVSGLSNLSIASVPRNKPITRSQFSDAVKYWPTHFHENKRLEKALSGELFTDEQLSQIKTFMSIAMQEAKAVYDRGIPKIGAVITDPLTCRVVASGHTHCSHPLKHAVMVCIDAVAMEQGGGAWQGKGKARRSLLQPVMKQGGDISVSGTVVWKGDECESGDVEAPSVKRSKKDVQYLCTGYDLYVTKEPCIMCAMALVHSRIGRVFYGSKDPLLGGLGSQYKVHVQQGLNHHFEVFQC